MARRKYMSPSLLTITPGAGDTPIVIGGSQGTIGDVDEFKIDEDSFFNALDDEEAQAQLDMIYMNCGDIEFADMDTDKNFLISYSEFMVWYAANQPW